MILAGLLLLGVGLVDIVRPLVPAPRRWIAWAAIVALLLFAALGAGALVPGAIAALGVVGWAWLMAPEARVRAGFWPAVGILAACAVGLAVLPPRPHDGWLGAVWHVASPIGAISFEQSILVLGVMLFLTEPANAIVRVALASEHVPRAAASEDDASADQPALLKGGRLIGPIERIIVLSLTLASAYPLLAAFIAAKGIVRFPEISKDSGQGNRAEYFLIGSLVSWLMGLASAFLLWWSFGAPGV